MRLYHHPLSSNAQRVVMTAHHLGLPLELVLLDLFSTEQRKHLLAINPNEKVPVLVDGDFILWESCAIMQYLADQTPGQTVYPTELRARADVNRWMFWSAQHFAPAIGIFHWENFIKGLVGAGRPDPLELQRGLTDLETYAGVLDRHLARRQWVSGPDLTLADLAIAAPLMVAAAGRVPLQPYTNLQAWFCRVQELDAWRQTTLEEAPLMA
ncbi:glutathione S-transferase, C-terminal domain protein [Collimonas fungivorans]|uniref:Glutathione S-transferase, C-terminal domain protein n=1 Tax=Collimonas fungivorans TaxID=158899 RepID=A0A127P652_9BURK|nr:glutathione S-transferase family protein [Collimonas fungivorans]AMO92921.1 glutathione S-transferase, C-terminal domain protein [Collimonas fungivorans]